MDPVVINSSSFNVGEISDDGSLRGWPAGLKFWPTQEILVQEYLLNKVLGLPVHPQATIKEMDIFLHDPHQLPIKITNGLLRRMYFFVYMTEEKKERSTPNGYWKLVEGDKPLVFKKPKREMTVLRSSYVYYTREKGPNGRYKTKWTMEEFRLENVAGLEDPKMEKWVACKIETKIPREY